MFLTEGLKEFSTHSDEGRLLMVALISAKSSTLLIDGIFIAVFLKMMAVSPNISENLDFTKSYEFALVFLSSSRG